jgi:hypothetical protein
MRQALELALDALQFALHVGFPESSESQIKKGEKAYQQHRAAITAIKEALAQPEQEPVATDWERIARVQNAKLMAMCNEAGGFEKLCEVMDKYEQTTPPQRKPLTEQEIYSVLENLQIMYNRPPTTDSRIIFTRAIEAAHGIKENT